jgi:hypothetical protein
LSGRLARLSSVAVDVALDVEQRVDALHGLEADRYPSAEGRLGLNLLPP